MLFAKAAMAPARLLCNARSHRWRSGRGEEGWGSGHPLDFESLIGFVWGLYVPVLNHPESPLRPLSWVGKRSPALQETEMLDVGWWWMLDVDVGCWKKGCYFYFWNVSFLLLATQFQFEKSSLVSISTYLYKLMHAWTNDPGGSMKHRTLS